MLGALSDAAGARLVPKPCSPHLVVQPLAASRRLSLLKNSTAGLMNLAASIANGDYEIHANEMWDPENWPAEAKGWGYTEAPRGSLGHWIHVEDKKIENYQAIVPSTWNCSPRDALNQPGPYEAALVGTPIANEEMPLEVSAHHPLVRSVYGLWRASAGCGRQRDQPDQSRRCRSLLDSAGTIARETKG